MIFFRKTKGTRLCFGEFIEKELKMASTLAERILELKELKGEKLAVAFRKERLTYRELADTMLHMASALAELKVEKELHVLCTAPSKPETVVAYLALGYLGATAVLSDKNSTPENAFALYHDSGSSLFLTDLKLGEVPSDVRTASLKTLYKNARAAAEDGKEPVLPEYTSPEPETLSEMIFTSGTTGKPKGVMLSYRAIYTILHNTIEGIGIYPDDVTLVPLPLHHSLALREVRAILWQGGTLVLQNGFTFAREVESNLDQFGCTGMVAVPVSMELLRTQMQDHFYEIIGRFRYLEIGAGALSVEQRKRLSKNLPNTDLNNTWGSSETGGVLFTKVHEVAGNDARVSTLGYPVANAALRMIGEDGKDAGTDHDHPGKLAIRGRMTTSGYWGMPELTAETLVDGWLITNDLCYADADGYIYMLGRSDDIMNIGGEKLSPLEIENIACEAPGVRECACIGVADPQGILGQVPLLFVAPDEHYSEEEVRKYLAEHMERWKLPVEYRTIDALPRNLMQKLDRKVLRKMAAE